MGVQVLSVQMMACSGFTTDYRELVATPVTGWAVVMGNGGLLTVEPLVLYNGQMEIAFGARVS